MTQNPSSDQWLIIRNPAAGNGAVARQWPAIEQGLQAAGLKYEARLTKNRGHAIQLAQEGVERGFRKVMALGGDGTNNEVINGILLQQAVPSAEVLYALLPIGTGNDWRRTYKIPGNLEAFIQMLLRARTRLQDIGIVAYHKNGRQQKRYFANVAGMAYDAFVVKEIEKKSFPAHNKLLYLYMILRCLWKYQLQTARVSFDEQEITDRFYTINVGICSYSGGGLQLVPHAVPDDGLLALTLAGPLSKPAILLNTYRFYNGTVTEHPKVSAFQTKRIRVESSKGQPVFLEVDGELLGHTPVEFGLLEKALRVVVP